MSNHTSTEDLEREIEELERQAGVIASPHRQEQPEEEEPEVEKPVPQEDPEEASFRKRYADLRRGSQREIEELKNELKELRGQLKEAEVSKAPTSVEDVKRWAQENPKAAEIIRSIARESAPVPKEDVKKVAQELSLMKSEAAIRKAHPDFDDIKDDPSFHDWAEAQPKKLQNMIYGSDAEDVIWALNQYKKEQPRKDTSVDAAKAVTKSRTSEVPGGKSKAFSESQVNAMSLSEYEANEEAIQKSMREGTFVYDLSGGAR